jgi:hypothetical protein
MTRGRIHEEDVPRAHFNRQRPTIEAALERLNLQGNAVVVDAVAGVHARVPVTGRPVEPTLGPKLFRSLPRVPVRKGCTSGLISSTRLMFLTSVSNS